MFRLRGFETVASATSSTSEAAPSSTSAKGGALLNQRGHIRPDRGFACAPTNDGLTMVVAGWPYAEAQAYKADVEANFLQTLELVPEFAARVSQAKREAPFLGGAVPGWFRKPYGDGWALVGDAGYNKDPITAQGISDASSTPSAAPTPSTSGSARERPTTT